MYPPTTHLRRIVHDRRGRTREPGLAEPVTLKTERLAVAHLVYGYLGPGMSTLCGMRTHRECNPPSIDESHLLREERIRGW